LMELLDRIEKNLQRKTRLENYVKKRQELDTVVIDKDKDNLDMEVEMGMETSNQDLEQMQEALINVEKEIKIERYKMVESLNSIRNLITNDKKSILVTDADLNKRHTMALERISDERKEFLHNFTAKKAEMQKEKMKLNIILADINMKLEKNRKSQSVNLENKDERNDGQIDENHEDSCISIPDQVLSPTFNCLQSKIDNTSLVMENQMDDNCKEIQLEIKESSDYREGYETTILEQPVMESVCCLQGTEQDLDGSGSGQNLEEVTLIDSVTAEFKVIAE